MAHYRPCYVIAEAGVNHNGSEAIAKEMINVAVDAGADAIKFQTFKADKLVTNSADTATYQRRATGEASQQSMLRKLELPDAAYHRLADHCCKLGIDFLSTPFDSDAVSLLVTLGCRYLKIASGEITNEPLLKVIAKTGRPMILSTGMCTLSEVSDAVEIIRQTRSEFGFDESLDGLLTLLHCTSSYPTMLEDVNLRAMQTLAEYFKLPVGYSDHTLGIEVGTLARCLGASIFEKHFTLDRKLDGPDHKSSLEPDELKQLVSAIHTVDVILGKPQKEPNASEIELKRHARRSLTVNVSIPQNTVLKKDMLTLMRPGAGISPKDMEIVLGRRVSRAMEAGETLRWDDLLE